MKSLFGYGITTKEIAKEGGWNIYDDSFKDISTDEYGNLLLPSSEFEPEKSTLEITSPGIPPNNPLILKARNLISEFDYFYKKMPFSIWVTGTNGKTTTTQMISYLLKNSVVGGNIGVPLATLSKDKIWVLETSSFQLHYTKIAKPNIFVILPIKEDHISWHGSFENYVNAKLSPLKRMTERDVVIMPKEFKDYETKAYKVLYENEEDLIKRFNFKNLKFKTPFLLDEVLAKTVYYVLYLKEASLECFKIDEHKLEEIKDNKGRVWVDDSKATNIDATINALKRYKDKEIHLILGGVDKGQNFKPLYDLLKNLNIKLYIIGEDTDLFENMAKNYKIDYNISKTLKNAIKQIDKKHNLNSVALLSPACASFDQFSGYKQRGDTFKKLIKDLK